MKKRLAGMAGLLILSAGLLTTAPSAHATVTSYSTPGTYSFVVPGGVTCLSVDALGAGGGGGSGTGGSGAHVFAYVPVAPGDTLSIGVGSGGGGGNAGGGGGLTRLHGGGAALIIAGGGGGGAIWNVGSGGNGAALGTSAGGDGVDVTSGDGSAGLGGHDGIGGAGGSTLGGQYVAASGGSVDGGNGVNAGFGPGSTGAIDINGGAFQNGTGSAGGGAGHGGGGGSSWVSADGTAGAGGSLGPVGASFSPGSNGGAVGSTGGDGSLSIDIWNGECSTATPPSAATMVTLSLADQAGGARCPGGNVTGYRGTWITLPTSAQCLPTDSAAPRESTLLGWATTARFPGARAQDQVDRHWGAIDEQVDGVRMIFIPAGMSVFLTADNLVYPIWAP